MGNGPEPCPETIVGVGELQDIGSSGRDVKLVFFRTFEVELVDGKFPLVMGEGYPLVEGVLGINPGNLSVSTPANSPVFAESVGNNGSHDIRVRVYLDTLTSPSYTEYGISIRVVQRESAGWYFGRETE